MAGGGKAWDTAGEFLACPLGGALIALGLWFLLREPCPVAGVDLGMECVKFAGATAHNPGELGLIGGLIGLGVGFLIWLVRH